MSVDSVGTLGVAATFSAEPIEPALSFWWSQLKTPVGVQLAPFNQIMPQLLDRGSMLNAATWRALLVRWEDWARDLSDSAALERAVGELARALSAVARPTLVVICHPSPAAVAARGGGFFARLDAELAAAVDGAVTVVSPSDLDRLYPVARPHDPYGERTGAVPYVSEYYAALATRIARQVARWRWPAPKVIVLDADDTLWRGACAELGPDAVVPAVDVQRFMRSRAEAGTLLCILSRNEPADVHAVFERQPDMPLARAHFAAERINWRPKPENLRELARELDVSLDRFVFVDDDPVQCAAVAAECPTVLTVHVPAGRARNVLDHVWPLDLAPVTADDRRRTERYHERRARDAAQATAPSLAAFLASLELEVDLRPLTADHAARVAQLSERTTQFNSTGRRWLEADLRAALASGEVAGVIAEVRDRFGDYGLVGAMIYRPGDVLDVEGFMLSCRALGRGVEHRMLAHLGGLAREGLRLTYVATPRNTPALTFLTEVATPERGNVFVITAEQARQVTYTPPERGPEPAASAAPAPAAFAPDWSRLARELSRAADVEERVLASRRRTRTGAAVEPPAGPTEARMVAIWERAFALDRVSRNDDFFELGGHSLLATQVLSAVCAELGVDLPLATIFAERTPAALAAAVDRARTGDAAKATLPTLTPAPQDRHEPFPMAPLQFAGWVGRDGSLALGRTANHAYLEIDCDGLDLERYALAWRGTIARHDMLRAVILPDGQLQVLASPPPFKIPVLDLSGRPAGEVEGALAERRAALSDRMLDVHSRPGFDVRATRMDGGRVRLHISFEGTLFDAASRNLVLGEVARRYEDPSAPWAALAITYRDHRLAERACEGSPRWQRARDYWLARASALPPAPDLPLARAPEMIARPQFVRRTLRVPAAIWSKLQQEAARRSVTGSGVVLAAFSEVLAAWSASPRFTLNLTAFNRAPLHPQVDELVGAFASQVLLEVDAAGAPGFAGRARAVQEQLWRDLDHREMSGTDVLRELNRTRGGVAAMPVVFTSTLALRRAFGRIAPAGARTVFSCGQTPQIWLEHLVFEENGELLLVWDSVDELFEPGMLDAMFAAYGQLVHELAEAPGAWSRAGFALTPPAQLAIRAAANDTRAPVSDALLHELFEAQAAARPDALAIVTEERRLTYGATARLARQLARRLRGEGVRPGSLVAVSMRRGWEQVVAALGILEAGGAYLPLDPELPAERRAEMASAAGVQIVVTQPGLELEWPAGVRTFALSDDALGSFAGGPLERVQASTDLAYVIYTSGSTGRPKGVMIDHRGAVNTILDVNSRLGVGPEDRVLQISSMSFDLSVYDIFGLLAAGGTIVMPRWSAHPEPTVWRELLERERVSIWNSVPALLELALEASDRPLPASLRAVLLSGDWIPTALPAAIRAAAPAARIVSMGGATEASIWSIWHDVTEADAQLPSIPYGRPMVNQTWHVLDERLAPRPAGVPGPLFIGGIGLALGYLGDAELTGRRFFVHPETGERLYRTGDVGRYRPDGSIELLGREDLQVKIRGHRIELGDVEAALRAHPAVRAVVALAVGEARRARRLVAFVVLSDAVALPELTELAARKLPEYMVPSTVHVVDALPLTPNGKVDRKALAARASSLPAPRVVPAPAVSPVAARLSEMVAEVLQLPSIDLAAGFLAQGGDSLSGMRLISRIRDHFGTEVSLGIIFEDFTLLEMAGEVERLSQEVAR